MSFSNDGSISNDGPISVDPFGLTARITHPQRYTNHFQHFATLKTRMFVCYLLCCGRLLFVWYLFVLSICICICLFGIYLWPFGAHQVHTFRNCTVKGT